MDPAHEHRGHKSAHVAHNAAAKGNQQRSAIAAGPHHLARQPLHALHGLVLFARPAKTASPACLRFLKRPQKLLRPQRPDLRRRDHETLACGSRPTARSIRGASVSSNPLPANTSYFADAVSTRIVCTVISMIEDPRTGFGARLFPPTLEHLHAPQPSTRSMCDSARRAARRPANHPAHSAARRKRPARRANRLLRRPRRHRTELLPISITDFATGRCKHLDGSVVLSAVIDAAGMPRDVDLFYRSGLALDEVASRLVKSERFRPGTFNGAPAAVAVEIELDLEACASLGSTKTSPAIEWLRSVSGPSQIT